MELVHSGKVRDIYRDRDDIILVASDRVSVYDVVLPTPIPDKGRLLTALSLWWFAQLSDVIDNHVISSTDVPPQFAGRAIRCRALDMIEFECVARGYLTGSGLRDYRESGQVCGITLPPGLTDGSALPEPIFTPSTKAPVGQHDAPVSFAHVREQLGEDTATRLKDVTIEIYKRSRDIASARGIIVADTKLEFGWAADGTLVVGDELLTSDSSRFWAAESWQPGDSQRSFDKQFIRDWAVQSGWDRRGPAPEVPAEVVAATRQRYVDAYEKLTGRTWS